VGFCARQRLLWAVPLMDNERVTGGIVASVPERLAFSPSAQGRPLTSAARARTCER
jgi:hypothetical protein